MSDEEKLEILQAAVARVGLLLAEWRRDDDEYLMRVGQHMMVSLEACAEMLDQVLRGVGHE